ncbi:hypothetical protein [Vibrio neptunius]|uniref:hypothetical protein n=1 Tax=Vibrio neptunius TaxID=170651 RepID=UPI0019D1780B|nr:hypothetical protein [Vibrio neptunius]MBN3571648.1 hypothetical protein [Vibrio neptunius]QXX05439.1 hypothetical protein KW548_09225 [Vibrio neptunius]
MTKSYVAFYPSKPYWAIAPLNVDESQTQASFTELMSEIVFEHQHEKFELAICRDGRIMLSLKDASRSLDLNLEETIDRWGLYLSYLNAFYLVLDSAIILTSRIAIFSLHEVTSRDAFSMTVEGSRVKGENISTESIASTYQMARYLSSYRRDIPLSIDNRILARGIVSAEALKLAVCNFELLFSFPGMEKSIASISKSISEYKIGNYDTSIVLAWFCIERLLSKKWVEYLISFNQIGEESKRVNSERLKKLTDRDYTISIIINMLELGGVLPFALYKKLEKIRVARNKIAHSDLKYKPNAEDSSLAINIALELVELFHKLGLKPSLSLQVSGI